HTPSLHDALPISNLRERKGRGHALGSLVSENSPNARNACFIAGSLSSGQEFSLTSSEVGLTPKSRLQYSIHALSGTKPCCRRTHFLISWSVARCTGRLMLRFGGS